MKTTISWYGMAKDRADNSTQSVMGAELEELKSGGLTHESISKIDWHGFQLSHGIPIFMANVPGDVRDYLEKNSAHTILPWQLTREQWNRQYDERERKKRWEERLGNLLMIVAIVLIIAALGYLDGGHRGGDSDIGRPCTSRFDPDC